MHLHLTCSKNLLQLPSTTLHQPPQSSRKATKLPKPTPSLFFHQGYPFHLQTPVLFSLKWLVPHPTPSSPSHSTPYILIKPSSPLSNPPPHSKSHISQNTLSPIPQKATSKSSLVPEPPVFASPPFSIPHFHSHTCSTAPCGFIHCRKLWIRCVVSCSPTAPRFLLPKRDSVDSGGCGG